MLSLKHHHEKPGEKRERLRQEELKKNPTGALKDGFNLVGDLGWKGTGILIVVLIVGYFLYNFFN